MVDSDTDVIVVGDGPAGLSAALFLAKNGLDVDVFGQDETFLHDALLLNYLGIEEMTGSKFIEVARRQVQGFGARFHDDEVEEAEALEDGGFAVRTAGGDGTTARYLVLATGPARELAEALGAAMEGDVVQTDRDGRTSVEGLYACGWTARGDKIQAAISVGTGAACGLDILSREAGEAVRDFDVPEG